MYAQHIRHQDIPSNYSGNAFRYPPIGSLGHEVASPAEVADRREGSVLDQEPVSAAEAVLPLPVSQEAGGTETAEASERSYARSLPILSALSGGGGIGSEELLLIGLILLLSGGSLRGHDRQGGDILPYLILLLVCG